MSRKPFRASFLNRNLSSEAANEPEPRWPAIVSGLAIGGLFLALPTKLSVASALLPPKLAAVSAWLPLAIIGAVQLPLVVARWRGRHQTNQILGFALLGIITAFLIASLGLLVHSLPTMNSDPVIARSLLRSAAALWLTNVLVFASWYWRLDGGGPHARDMRPFHSDGAFLFPQMSLDRDQRAEMGESDWSPEFMDYLFLAFNTSTALSPADTAVLSRWAKALMMVQAAISLTVLAVIAARAVNIL